jgi:L-alanine-DL-glutamate epimerase-like enolase superfamily enzyme
MNVLVYERAAIGAPRAIVARWFKAELARGTHLPIATGERVFTKWGFLDVLQKRAATILQPDVCHAGGITECRLIAGRNPLGSVSLEIRVSHMDGLVTGSAKGTVHWALTINRDRA